MKAPATRRDVFVRGQHCRGNYIGRGATGCPLANDSNHVSARYNVFVPRLRSRDVPAKKLIHQDTRVALGEKWRAQNVPIAAALGESPLAPRELATTNLYNLYIDRLTESLK